MTAFPGATALCHSERGQIARRGISLSSRTCTGGVRDLVLLLALAEMLRVPSNVIPNRDLWSSVRNLRFSHRLRFFLFAVVRMTSFCNFFPAAKKLPRKVARWLSGTPASRFARRRELRNSLRSNSPRPISVFSLAPGSPIKAGIFPLRHYRPLRVRAVAICHSEPMRGISNHLFEILHFTSFHSE